MGSRNKFQKKSQNGLSSEKLQDLRSTMRSAATMFGEGEVATALRFPTFNDALESVTIDMPKSDFGRAANTLKKMMKLPKVNKYAKFSKVESVPASVLN